MFKRWFKNSKGVGRARAHAYTANNVVVAIMCGSVATYSLQPPKCKRYRISHKELCLCISSNNDDSLNQIIIMYYTFFEYQDSSYTSTDIQ